MIRPHFCLSIVLAVSVLAFAEEKKAPGPPASPQESADRYFAAMGSARTPDPAPMMVVRFKMTPEQVAGHARTVAAQIKDKALKSQTIVAGQKLARVISAEVAHVNGDKAVVFIDLEKDGDAWLISDVNCLVSSQLNSIIQGFKETKDPKAVVQKAR